TTVNICEYDSFVTNKNYCAYLSNFEVPNIIFVATLLIIKMNKINVNNFRNFKRILINQIFGVKLEMTVLHIENDLPYVQLNLCERNLNTEIRAIVSQSSSLTTTIVIK
ncbi:unnamed protein product, partial [Rotaria sp. Silwood2]